MHEPQILQTGILVARFFRDGDRYAHEIGVQANSGFIALVSSSEGTPDDEWPPSPVFQHLHVESRDGRQVMLLIGKAGDGHWSAAVEATTDGAILFDVACRCGQLPQRVGSEYRVEGENACIDLKPLDGTRIVPSCGNSRLAPAVISIQYPATLRWQYRLVRQVGAP